MLLQMYNSKSIFSQGKSVSVGLKQFIGDETTDLFSAFQLNLKAPHENFLFIELWICWRVKAALAYTQCVNG